MMKIPSLYVHVVFCRLQTTPPEAGAKPNQSFKNFVWVYMNREVFIVAAKRTAFGTFGGTLKTKTATDLGAVASKAAIDQIGGNASIIDAVFFGNVAHTDTSGPYIARHVALKAGVSIPTPALTVNRLCGSGFQSVVSGAQNILLGESEVVLTGGAESMSLAPYQVSGASVRWGTTLGANLNLEDSLWATLTDAYCKLPMVKEKKGKKKKKKKMCCFGVTFFVGNHCREPC